MELKSGYKQTEVGAIPVDWDVVQLGNLNPFVTSGSRGWASFYSEHGDLFVRITNMSRESIYLDLVDSKYVRVPRDSSEGVRTQLQEHDVLISITADIGIVSYVDARVPFPAYINQHIALVRFDPELVNGKFVSYFLAADGAQRNFRAKTDNGAKASMSLGGVAKIQAALPPHSEQSAIAEALGDVDSLLSSLDALVAKKRDLKQAAMQQLLTGKTRLSGFVVKAGCKQTEVGVIPEDWEVRRIGEVATAKDGTHQTPKYVAVGVPFYSVEQVTSGDFDNTKFISVEEHKFLTRSFRMEKGDVLMTRIGSIGDCKLIDWDVDASFYVSLALLKIRGASPAYFEQYSKTHAFKSEVELHSLASAIPKKINLGPISDVRIVLPPPAEQSAIAEVLSDMDAELMELQARRDKTRLLKQGMMQELLTGKTRLM
ncbi:restriction endonuclease subunit S [Burkholderia metallica]|uniref:restriction endonuclease subunit S n=1 Tax=Burkholderia metallica TaxID=488729 RepID=UPI00157AFD46|nr:restriction endonuclease subunit S [Burkholderia metallica]NTZ88912.1 restriction endonuclease subunit S [Burkholderia metallica]